MLITITVATVAMPVGQTVFETEPPEESRETYGLLSRIPAAASSYDPSGLDLTPSEELFNYTTPTPALAPVAVAAPAPAPPPVAVDALTPAPAPPPVAPLSTTQAAFLAGWYDAGGGALKGDAAVVRFVQCESGWRVWPGGQYYGLVQFSPGTWATKVAATGLADPYNPYHQGFNAAYHALRTSPGSTAGWPYCWWV